VNAMDERRRNDELDAPEPEQRAVIVRRRPFTRIATLIALTILVLFLIGVATVWVRRIPIATHYLKREFERRGVTASYHLDRVGLRAQEVSNLVIGDPKRPDLVARYAHIETRLKWNGNFEVYRIVARGVRLHGRLVHGKISWGQIDKLLPPPSNRPFALPDFVLDVADSSISLATPFGPLGIALEGNGKLSGGFDGRVAVVSPALTLGRCGGTGLHTYLGVSVRARRPSVKGPVTLDSFACPASRFQVAAPRFDANATFNEAFTRVDGNGRMAITSLVAGDNGLANFLGDITYRGSLQAVDGEVKLSAQNSRLATITAARTRLQGHYHLGSKDGTFNLSGTYAADNAMLAPSMLAGVTQPLAAAGKTPLGPVALGIGNALLRTARNFNSAGHIKVVNFPGGGAARIVDADVIGPNGASARIGGGSGVTYYWPVGGLRIDSDIEMAGGGLPQANVTLRQPHAGAPMSGVANIAPYVAGGQRLALTPIQFGPAPDGATAVSTIAQLDGRLRGGRVQALRLPITGDIGRGGSFAFGRSCMVVSFNYLQLSTFQLGATRLPVCPVGPAIIEKRPGGPVLVAARLNRPVLDGRLGGSPFHLQAAGGVYNGQQFRFDRLGMRLGRATSPVLFDAGSLTGRLVGSNIAGNFTGATASIGKVPLQLSSGTGRWAYRDKDLSIDAAATVSDRDPDPRFYPLRTNDLHFSLAGDNIRATGSLHHPASGTLVTNVEIQHRLSTGAGHATLDVPGLTFGPNLQPEELTRLTEGVVALVNGTVRGQGRIDWAEGGKVTSTGDFSTGDMNLAAPFGPVTGISTTIHFDDLLGISTPPGQLMTVQTVNPGITVTNGVIHYQLLPHDRVKIERGEWPFMGGQLILEETVLDFGNHSAKHLTFRLVGFDAKQFVDSLGFDGFELTGIFDGELPMVFDDSGGRIVGGRLVSRAPGGELKYTGTKPKGLGPGLAVDLLSDIRFRSMVIGLDGDLSGEFATKLTIDQVSLGPGHGFLAGLVHSAFGKLPLKLNVNINGPFRALIQMTKGFKDPTQVIAPVMPFPVDSPALKVEVLSTRKNEEQTPAPKAAPQPAVQSPPSGGMK
jgi:translocation and assembly module TamB